MDNEPKRTRLAIWNRQGTKIVVAISVYVLGAFGLWLLLDVSAARFIQWLFGWAFIFVLVLIVWHFTKPLPGYDSAPTPTGVRFDPWQDPNYVQIKRYWMALSYVFMILALAAAVIPFTIDVRKEPDEEGWATEHFARADAPISVIRACSRDPGFRDSPLYCFPDEKLASLAPEIARLSWIVQIGGYVLPFPVHPESVENFESRMEEIDQTIEKAQGARQEVLQDASFDELQSDLNRIQAKLVKTERALEKLKSDLAGTGKSPTPAEPADASGRAQIAQPADAQVDAKEAEVEELRSEAERLVRDKQKVMEHDATINRAREEGKWLMVGRDRFARGDAGYSVEGGLVVPFYLIVLSLIGGAVSLTRRIPEYQKQSAPGYVGTDTSPALTPAELRESLVFQIVQFISAPFIAAVAYYVLVPGTTAAAVSLAFAAGFASETVLLWVRAVVDRLRPEQTKEYPKGSLTGTISSLIGAPTAEDTKQQAAVSIIGHSELVPTYAGKGQFAVNRMPEGEYGLEVKLANGKICTERVAIQGGHAVPVWIECP